MSTLRTKILIFGGSFLLGHLIACIQKREWNLRTLIAAIVAIAAGFIFISK